MSKKFAAMTETATKHNYSRIINVLLIIGIAVVLVFLIRYCGNEKSASIAYENMEDSLRSELKKRDSVEHVARVLASRLKDADAVRQFAIEDMNMYHDLFNRASDRAETLARQVKAAKKDKDTVKYYEKCDSLADENIWLRQAITNNDSILKIVMAVTDVRIKKSDSLAEHWRLAYSQCIRTVQFASDELPKLKPKGKVYFDITGMAGAITAFGGGIGYMDANGRIINVDVLVSGHGNIYQLRLATPLNFKRKQ